MAKAPKIECAYCGGKFEPLGIKRHMNHCKEIPKVPAKPASAYHADQLLRSSVTENAVQKDNVDRYFDGRREGLKEGRLEGIGEAVIAVGHAIKNLSR